MNLTRAFGIGLRWWPAPVALIALVSMAMSAQIQGPGALVAVMLVLAGFAICMRWVWAAYALGLLGALWAAPTEPNNAWFIIAIGLVTAALASWHIEPLRLRLLSGLPIAVVAGIAITWQLSTQSMWWGLGGAIVPSVDEVLLGWLPAMLGWAAVIGARGLRDALRAESAKKQAVARTTVVESELRDERLRADLTHDFHDVMAHSLAVLAAQAEGLRLSHQQHPERIDPVLTTISDTARLALVEVRQLLERVDDDARRPQPTSADIPGVVAQLRSAGPRVALHDIGAHGHLSRLADIAAYRIVQESLTNALRHGGADIDIVVALTWTGPGLSIAIASPILDRIVLKPAGRGIAGMHERARLAGGTVEIDADGDSFVVSAYLPYEPISHEPTPPLTEEQLFTLPVPKQQRPEDVVAPWIVEATRLHQQRHPEQSGAQQPGAQPATPYPTTPYPTHDWSQATTVDLTDARLPDGRIRNPMSPDETLR
ncbi:Signal transduction histidine kinase [Agrococcus baldri]|uniref:histidine kinase n=1 Tax=Agrococcus baldri TaxID=153730 RepID=A0AA94HLG4_9MICO|nr:histidine kinase [Agrococcus baldri]SFS07134.1 Signal transduction histidine kinase [Agrococcus baldri]